ncbi:MAG TPA: hypothetical protein VF167_04585 [Longimicrobiaceae bacterium]
MLRLLLLVLLLIVVAVTVAPGLIKTMTWVLAFLSMLILGDLLLAGIRRMRGRQRR